jgi:glycosyltransferase involved in cell wall biosynthesis
MILRIAIRKLIVNREIEHYQKAVNVFDEIITVSSHSKYSMKHFLDIAKNKKINVFFSPRKFKNTYENINSYNSKETIEIGKYILMIGGNRWEKNVCRAIIALENLLEKGMLNDFRIVIVGELPKWVRKKIKHTEAYNLYGYLESEILESLYKNCSFFIFPSLNEGFGYPPLEAMAYGKTCIVSGVCALPEVCGSGVYYVNPYDINELKNRILQAIDTKIDPKIIEYYFDKTSKRQDEDLEKICDSIVSVNEN